AAHAASASKKAGSSSRVRVTTFPSDPNPPRPCPPRFRIPEDFVAPGGAVNSSSFDLVGQFTGPDCVVNLVRMCEAVPVRPNRSDQCDIKDAVLRFFGAATDGPMIALAVHDELATVRRVAVPSVHLPQG